VWPTDYVVAEIAGVIVIEACRECGGSVKIIACIDPW